MSDETVLGGGVLLVVVVVLHGSDRCVPEGSLVRNMVFEWSVETVIVFVKFTCRTKVDAVVVVVVVAVTAVH